MSRNCPRCNAPVEDDATVCAECRFILVQDEEEDEEVQDQEDIIPDGTVLSERYKIVRFIGMGGAGAVYEARELKLENMPVALKVLHHDLNEDPGTIALMKKEVIIARELTHDNIMKVFDFTDVDNRHFIVMEYVHGESLQDMLDRTGTCPFEQAATLFYQVCNALQYAHDRGIIHLDVKPANILVLTAGSVKLCDFGIARMAIGNVTTATQRIITGSVGYMPPEQYRGRKYVSHKSDIYALGATLYSALTGEVPIGIIDSEGVPKCVLRAMQRKPEDRFESVLEFRDCFIEETGFEPPAEAAPLTKITLVRDQPVEQPRIAIVEPPRAPVEDTQSTVGERDTVTRPGETVEPAAQSQVSQPKTTLQPAPVAVAPEPAVTVEQPDVSPRATEEAVPEKPTPSLTDSLLGNRVYLAAGAILVAVIALVIGLSVPETKLATPKPEVKPTPVKKKSFEVTDTSVKAPTGISSEIPAGMKKADKQTTEAVQRMISQFWHLFNFDQVDQAYAMLSRDLKSKYSKETFREDLFSSPRLWKITVKGIETAPDGRIGAKIVLEILDAYHGVPDKLKGIVWVVKQNGKWKIAGYVLS